MNKKLLCLIKHQWIYSDYFVNPIDNPDNKGTYTKRYCRRCGAIQENKPTWIRWAAGDDIYRVINNWKTTGYMEKIK